MKPEQDAPDANCYTLPNGECVSTKDCMHGPGVEIQMVISDAIHAYMHRHMNCESDFGVQCLVPLGGFEEFADSILATLNERGLEVCLK